MPNLDTPPNPKANILLVDDAPANLLALEAVLDGHRVLPMSSAAPLAEVIEECLTSRRPIVRRPVQMNRPEGGATHLGVTVSPIRDAGGAAHGAICLFSDLSEVVELEEQLRLKDSLARLGELTAGIAHEVRNGLATIHGYARLLEIEQPAG